MTEEIDKRADNHNDEISQIVDELTVVVEQEVRAFQSLYDALQQQQVSILQGDVVSVSQSNEEVETIVARTKRLEEERWGKSHDLSRCLDMDADLTLSQILPHVERRYALRLEELKQMLEALSQKIKTTNERNRYLLQHSLQFVNNCMRILVGGRENEIAYGKTGKVAMKETSLFSGVG